MQAMPQNKGIVLVAVLAALVPSLTLLSVSKCTLTGIACPD